jgi:hypothetical protein
MLSCVAGGPVAGVFRALWNGRVARCKLELWASKEVAASGRVRCIEHSLAIRPAGWDSLPEARRMERGREGAEPAPPVRYGCRRLRRHLTETWGNLTDCLRKGYGGAIASRTRDRSEAQPGEARSPGRRGAQGMVLREGRLELPKAEPLKP